MKKSPKMRKSQQKLENIKILRMTKTLQIGCLEYSFEGKSYVWHVVYIQVCMPPCVSDTHSVSDTQGGMYSAAQRIDAAQRTFGEQRNDAAQRTFGETSSKRKVQFFGLGKGKALIFLKGAGTTECMVK